MPYKDKEVYNNYMRIRYHKRLGEAKKFLGGKCVKCGTLEDLDFDHIDPSTKICNVTVHSLSDELFWIEVDKCQLLCRPCHTEKSAKENSVARQGSRNSQSILRELDIKYIWGLHRRGYGVNAITSEFNVTRQSISAVLKGKTWTWVDTKTHNSFCCLKPLPGKKVCTKCNLEKDLKDFGSDHRMKDGHTSRCSNCLAETALARYYSRKSKKA